MEQIVLLLAGIVLLGCSFADTTEHDINVKAKKMKQRRKK